jgi:LPXTG-site transpeptidase (sortase) family protein
MLGSKGNLRTLFRLGQLLLLGSMLAGLAVPARSTVRAESTTTPSTTPMLVTDLVKGTPSSDPGEMVAIGSTIFFRAAGDNTGFELWKIDAPYNQAVMAADVNPADGSSFPEHLTPVGDTLFFTADDGKTGREIWKIDPPYNQATRVADINPGSASSNAHDFVAVGNSLFFAANDGSSGDELWKTQPPYTSAERITDIWPGSGSANPRFIVHHGWTLFFAADDSATHEIWRCDPPYTAASTTRVTNLYPNGNAKPQSLTFVGDILFFSGIGNDGQYGPELWMTEPPYNTLSTRPVQDFETRSDEINPNQFPPNPYVNTAPGNLHAIGDTLFFSAKIGLIGREVWKVVPPYDTVHMTRVKDVNTTILQGSDPSEITSIGTDLFFIASDPIYGARLWHSVSPYDDDHTEAIETSDPNKFTNPKDLTPVNNTLYFTAENSRYSRQIWRSDPTYQLASMTGDRNAGIRTSNPTYLTAIGSVLFFQATTAAQGAELWTIGGHFGIPVTGFAPNVRTHLEQQPASKAYQSTDLSVEIPSLGIKSTIVGVPAMLDGSDWDLSWLGSKTGYLAGTAFPTWNGNSVLTGHAVLADGTPGPFARLASLKWGDQVIIHAYGKDFTYEVRANDVVRPNDLSVFRHEERPWITLITCHNYDAKTNTYLQRIAVRAVMVNAQ